MKIPSGLVATALIASTATALAADAAAATAATPPAASRYYPFLGHWKGHGEISEPGQSPTPVSIAMSCSKVSSGWAVRCDMEAKNDTMTITESDLMGVDPVTGTGHWYAVTNQGETHDHVTQWPDAKSMTAHHAWTQDGKTMEEDIAFVFTDDKSLTFRSTVSEDGKAAGDFFGKLSR